ncbi:acyltransferase, partial [Ruminococcus sp.]|uniref:acyltransferase n=1 Tax=Ruminococcus sp. TaxID=41978 RepID=UPI0025FB749F
MDWFRLKHTICLCMQSTGFKRADYIRKKKLFRHVGDHCMFMFRKLPLYGDLISIGNNVFFASNVSLVTHDVTHKMLNCYDPDLKLTEYIGCIDIGDNVFVGANTTILYNSRIPSNTIIGANSFVNKKLMDGGVYAGSPVRYICSMEEFLNKRKKYTLQVKRKKSQLSEATIDEAWKQFNALKEKNSGE